MKIITIDRAVVEQALDDLRDLHTNHNITYAGTIWRLEAALAQEQAEPVQEPVACLVGIKGSAFDLPTTKRAYTYAKQPGNVVASRLGSSCNAAALQSAGDTIDRGLALLQELQKQGFGVFDLGAEYTSPPKAEPVRKPLSPDETMALANETVGSYWGDEAHFQRFRAAIERAHGIGGQDE